MEAARSLSQTSTRPVTATGLASATASPSTDRIPTMWVVSALNSTRWMPAKSFLRCAYAVEREGKGGEQGGGDVEAVISMMRLLIWV